MQVNQGLKIKTEETPVSFPQWSLRLLTWLGVKYRTCLGLCDQHRHATKYFLVFSAIGGKCVPSPARSQDGGGDTLVNGTQVTVTSTALGGAAQAHMALSRSLHDTQVFQKAAGPSAWIPR